MKLIYTKKCELAKTRKTAVKNAPGAAVIKKVTGGYMAFETVTDYKTWRNQR